AGRASASTTAYTLVLQPGVVGEPESVRSISPGATQVTIVKAVDKLSPTLAQAVALGAMYNAVDFIAFDTVSSPHLEIGTYEFTNVIFTSVALDSSGPVLLETITFVAAAAKFAPKNVQGSGLPASAIIALPADQPAPSGFTLLGNSALVYFDASNRLRTLP